jgi:hypothetical protein
MFVPPLKKNSNVKPTSKETAQSTAAAEEKEDSKWSIIDTCCLPYKVLFAPATMVVKAVANKVK